MLDTIVLITGSRTYDDYAYMDSVLSKAHRVNPFVYMILGDAKGADTLAHKWAENNNVPISTHFADWNRYGRAAGPRRNHEMACDLIEAKAHWKSALTVAVAFTDRPLAESIGTANCVQQVTDLTNARIVHYHNHTRTVIR